MIAQAASVLACSFQICGYPIDAGLRAFVVSARRSGDADGADHFVACLDRQAAGYREDAADSLEPTEVGSFTIR
jgi:hypothetical protein